MLRPRSIEKSPRIDPGLDARGCVSPSIWRPCLMMSLPSQHIQTTGPSLGTRGKRAKEGVIGRKYVSAADMCAYVSCARAKELKNSPLEKNLQRPPKKGFELRSE